MRYLAFLWLCVCPAWAAEFSDGVSDDRLSLPDGPGSLEGIGDNVSVGGNMGVMRHHVAINLPAGFPGATPSLALSYSSGSGDSELGVGWKLEVESVERMTARGLPDYLDSDKIVASDDELVRVDNPAGGAVYRSRYETGFVRWVWHSPGTAGYWEAQYPDGKRGFFGADRNGTPVPEARIDGVGGTFRYHLVETVDVFGHRVRYDWTKTAGGYALLTGIRWLFYDDAAGLARYAVSLRYETRPDILSDACSGVEVRLDQRLIAVDVLYQGASGLERVRGYELTYDPNAWLSQLQRVRQFGLGDPTNQSPYPVVHTFAYTQAIGATSGLSLQTVTEKLTGASLGGGRATLIDLNGDTLPDVIDASLDGPHRIWLAQLDPSGQLHFIGPTLSALGTRAGFPLDSPYVTTMDVNGDGFTDLIRSDTAEVLINDGSGDWVRKESLGGGLPDLMQAASLRFYDYDGDKRIDVLQSTVGGTAVFRNGGGGSFAAAPVDPLGIDFSGARVNMADMNGDGQLDVVLIEAGQLQYRLNLGHGKWAPAGMWNTVLLPVDAADLPFVMLEDLNGDSLADLVIVEGSYVKFALNRNGAAFDAMQTVTSAGGSTVPERLGTTTVVTADMNGNGSSDIVWIDNTGQVSWLELFAVRPNLLTHIENGLGRVTDVSYGSTVHEMVVSPSPWKHRLPFPMTVVTSVDEWDRLTGLHDVSEYQYADGYYDGDDKQYRGHEKVQQHLVGDASQEDGQIVNRFDVGDSDRYLNGQLLAEEVSSGGRLLRRETHEFQKCAVELEVASPTLTYPIFHACEVKETVEHWEGATTPITTEVDTEYDGFGNVTKESELGDLAQMGDEHFTETSYVPRAMTGGAWIIHAPYREIEYGRPGGDTAETLTYYDGAPFEGLMGQLTQGLVTRVTEKVDSNQVIATARSAYDANGMLTDSLDGDGSPMDDTQHRRHYSYDADGLRPIEAQIRVGSYQLVRRARQDARFNEIVWASSWMRVAGTAASGENPTELEYDGFGRLLAIHKPDPATGQPSAMPTTWFGYELASPKSRVLTWSALDGEKVRCFDGRGRVYQEKMRTAAGSYLATGFTTFNKRGQPVQTYQPYTSATADCDDAPPQGTLSTSYRYDAADREISHTLPDGSVESVTFEPLATLSYDGNDNDPQSPFANTPTLHRTDGLERVIALGRTLTADQPPSLITIQYDELGRMSGVTDAAGHQKTQRFDLAGRLFEIGDPNGGKTTFAYDDAGNQVSLTDGRGMTTRLAYDGANRLVERWIDGDRDATLRAAVYDADPGCADCSNTAGRVASLIYPGGKDSFGYDVRGRILYRARVLDGFLYETRNQYDDRDRLTASTYPDERMLTYAYDDADRLSSMAGVIEGVAYDARGLVSEIAFANGTNELRGYDPRMQLSSLSLGSSSAMLQSLSFQRDRAENLTSVADPDGALAAEYQYDAWYRLLHAKLGDDTFDYAYDAVDNILSAKSSRAADNLGNYTYDASRPNAVTRAGERTYEYDAAGNVTRRAGKAFAWDGFGRMAQAELGDGTARYLRDASDELAVSDEPHAVIHRITQDFEVQDGLGMVYARVGKSRVARLVATGLAAKLYPDAVPDGKITAGDAWLAGVSAPTGRMLLSGARRILYEEVAADTWLGHDQLGSITVETDSRAQVIGRRSFTLFGEVRSATGDTDRYGFTGQEQDESGLLLFQHRELDPALGRWSSVDPAFSAADKDNIGHLGESTTAYAYVANNTASHVDPSGLVVIGKGSGKKAADEDRSASFLDRIVFNGKHRVIFQAPSTRKGVSTADLVVRQQDKDTKEWSKVYTIDVYTPEGSTAGSSAGREVAKKLKEQAERVIVNLENIHNDHIDAFIRGIGTEVEKRGQDKAHIIFHKGDARHQLSSENEEKSSKSKFTRKKK